MGRERGGKAVRPRPVTIGSGTLIFLGVCRIKGINPQPAMFQSVAMARTSAICTAMFLQTCK